MKTTIIFLLLSTFLFSTVGAQTTGVVHGDVKDKNTQETIVGAVVSVEGTTTLGTTTDVDQTWCSVFGQN